MWTALWAIAYKELLQVTRNKFIIRRLLQAQILNFIMLAWINLAVRNMPTVVVDQDRTTESRLIVERIVATQTFAVKYMTSSVEQARDHVRAGRAKVAIVIPPDFAEKRHANATANVLALVDGSDSIASRQAMVAIDGVVARMNLELQQDQLEAEASVTPHVVLMFNPEGRTPSFMLPALLALILGTGYSGASMRRLVIERAGGQLERLLMTPMNYVGFILGKLVPWFFVGMGNVVVFLVAIRFLFDVPIRGGLPLLLGAAALYVATVLALGSCIAAGSRDMREANTTWSFIIVPAFFVSGYVFPLSALPRWLLPFSYLLPQTHFIEVMRGVCLRGADARELAPHLLYLLVAPVILSLVAAARFQRSILD